jgi:hypothetical protein
MLFTVPLGLRGTHIFYIASTIDLFGRGGSSEWRSYPYVALTRPCPTATDTRFVGRDLPLRRAGGSAFSIP